MKNTTYKMFTVSKRTLLRLSTFQQLRRTTTQRRRSASSAPINIANLLVKPALFTSFVVGGSFGVTAVVERLNVLQLPAWAVEMNRKTPYLWPFVAPVILANAAIFMLWHRPLPPFFLDRLFLSHPGIPTASAMLGSTFSHKTVMHLGFNMFAFYGFARATCHSVGSGDAASMYLTCGVVSSWVAGVVTSFHPLLRALRMPSLGASGAVLGLVSFSAFSRPDMEVSLIFLPMISFPAIQALAGLVLFDCVGLVLGWRALGHAAHLAGVGCGALFHFGGLDMARKYQREVRLKVDMAKRWYRDRIKQMNTKKK